MRQLSKAWIFVSHSTRDIESVRRVRNALEARGAEPILFFLKALDTHEELRALLHREIDARSHFLVCDSEAARASTWVRDEQDYVRTLLGKRVTGIDLDAAWEMQETSIEAMLKTATIFLSYASKDWDRVRPFAKLLADHDFAVWTDEDLPIGQDWGEQIDARLAAAAQDGYLVVFLSAASLASLGVSYEISAFQALAGAGRGVILVDLEPVDHLLPPAIQGHQRLRIADLGDPAGRRMLLAAVGLG